MKKNEINKILENELKTIKVSNELKEKTLNNIYNKNNVYHLPIWIKNTAAIFIVTCICLSIYLANNRIKLDNSVQSLDEINNLDTNITEAAYGGLEKEESLSAKKTLKFSAPLNDYVKPENATNKEIIFDTSDNLLNERLIEDSSILTEEEFLLNNPEAKKLENGYLITENNEKIIYIFNNGLFIEKNIFKK
jgi:hypothetical protein